MDNNNCKFCLDNEFCNNCINIFENSQNYLKYHNEINELNMIKLDFKEYKLIEKYTKNKNKFCDFGVLWLKNKSQDLPRRTYNNLILLRLNNELNNNDIISIYEKYISYMYNDTEINCVVQWFPAEKILKISSDFISQKQIESHNNQETTCNLWQKIKKYINQNNIWNEFQNLCNINKLLVEFINNKICFNNSSLISLDFIIQEYNVIFNKIFQLYDLKIIRNFSQEIFNIIRLLGLEHTTMDLILYKTAIQNLYNITELTLKQTYRHLFKPIKILQKITEKSWSFNEQMNNISNFIIIEDHKPRGIVHLLVIPKYYCRNLCTLIINNPEDLTPLLLLTDQICKLLENFGFLVFFSTNIGKIYQSESYLHVHIVCGKQQNNI